MRNRPGIWGAVAATSLLVAGCQGGRPLNQSAGGAPGASSGGAGGQVRDGGLGRDPRSRPDAGPPSDAGPSQDAGALGDAGGATGCTPLGAIPRRLWRLSAEQWGHAVQSLLSLSAPPVLSSRGGEASFALWDNASLAVDGTMLFDVYNLLGEATDEVDPMVAGTVAPCTGTTAEAQTSCATSFVQAFAKRAYRRPLAAEELSDLMTVYQQGATSSYSAGIELVMKAVLASPSFLFRTELGPSTLTADAQGTFPDTKLTPYEVASQLSFTLLGNLPDAPLMDAAADGSVATPAGITAQIDRLLAMPAAQDHLTDVVLKWLGVGQVFLKVKDVALLSPVSSSGSDEDQSSIRNDLWLSARHFVSSILWNGSGKIDDLLTAQTFYVNARLAKLYPDAVVAQAPTDNTTFVAATWPASQGRSGLLTQPSYLWAASDPALASIVKRGKGIHDDVLCQDPVGSPVDLSTPAATNVITCKSPDGTQTLSPCNSEVLKSDARLAFEPCHVCHAQLDPYARVLQNFGPIGNFRTLDEASRPIDPVAAFVPTQPPVLIDNGPHSKPESISVPGSPLGARTLTGAQAFAKAVISIGAFNGCAAQRMLGTAIGQHLYANDTCELRSIRAASDGTMRSLFVNLFSPDFMRTRAGGPQ